MLYLFLLPALAYPNCLHAISASGPSQPSAQISPHRPLTHIWTAPICCMAPLTSLISPCWHVAPPLPREKNDK